MKFEVFVNMSRMVVVTIKELGIVAVFKNHDKATKFIQAVLNNITRY